MFAFLIVCDWELPPRARRIQVLVSCSDTPRGTTSACAENTFSRAVQHGATRNYLRVRGEYALLRSSDRVYSELPPRARRIPGATLRDFQKHGTTSACAENTLRRSSRHSLTRNYLRVRGEYAGENIKNRFNEELPPRARRILSIRPINQQDNGTTSACAENTTPAPQIIHVWWNYLRVRGEYSIPSKAGLTPPELPPRARRIRMGWRSNISGLGTTSACAENTGGG